jgi:hypothetical protein
MPILRTRLAYEAKGSWNENEDWTDLVFDTDKRRLYVEHTWDRVKISNLQRYDEGSVEVDVNAFLASNGPGRDKLVELLTRLFG